MLFESDPKTLVSDWFLFYNEKYKGDLRSETWKPSIPIRRPKKKNNKRGTDTVILLYLDAIEDLFYSFTAVTVITWKETRSVGEISLSVLQQQAPWFSRGTSHRVMISRWHCNMRNATKQSEIMCKRQPCVSFLLSCPPFYRATVCDIQTVSRVGHSFKNKSVGLYSM